MEHPSVVRTPVRDATLHSARRRLRRSNTPTRASAASRAGTPGRPSFRDVTVTTGLFRVSEKLPAPSRSSRRRWYGAGSLGPPASGVRDDEVALVGDLPAPQPRVGQVAHLDPARTTPPRSRRSAAAVSPAPVDQSPSTSTSRPPGRSAATQRPHRQRRVGQRPQHVPAEHDVDGCRCQPGVGGVPVAHGHEVAHPARRGRELGAARGSPWRARSRARRRRTRARRAAPRGCPCRSRGRRRRPARGGSTPSSRSRQAARTSGSSSPWSGASSNAGASASQSATGSTLTPRRAGRARRRGCRRWRRRPARRRSPRGPR